MVEHSEGSKRIYLTDDAAPPAVMALRLDWDGADKTWVVTSFRDERGQVARHLRTSDEPDASVSSRIPDTTGHPENSASGAEFQDDDLARAIAGARAALEAEPDLTLRMGAGQDAREISLADLLDDLDRDEALVRSMTSCSLKGSPKRTSPIAFRRRSPPASWTPSARSGPRRTGRSWRNAMRPAAFPPPTRARPPPTGWSSA